MSKPKKLSDINIATEPVSLENLLTDCKVDRNIWEIEKHNLKTRADGKVGYEIYLKKKEEIKTVDWFKNILKEVEIYRKTNNVILPDSNLLYEMNLPDLHLSKMAWGQETGYKDYDTKISCAYYNAAIDDFIARLGILTPRILLPIGNDFFNADTPTNTTAAGTVQDVDTRWQKSFRAGCILLSGVIEKLSKTYKVDVVVVVGNHDTTRMWYLGEYLAAWFKDNTNVTIDNSPKLRKYYEFGKNLFMFTHGDKEKQADLPLIMATEQPLQWGRTKWRFIRLGHYHSDIQREQCGVKTNIVPSLCPPDEWHSSKGYVGNVQAAMAFLYDRNKGLLTVHYHNAK